VTPRLLTYSILLFIFIFLSILFNLLLLISQNDQLELPQH